MLRAAGRVSVRYLTEPVMGFLALAALSVGIAPMLFALPPRFERALWIVEWAIIAAFAVEYLAHLAAARDKRAFVLNPWRIVDAIIIVAALVSLLPWAPGWMRSSPALRVLRLARVIIFGTRVRRGLSAADDEAAARPSEPFRVSALAPDRDAPQAIEWRELLAWAARPTELWMHAANLDAARIKELAAAVGLPHVMVDAALRETSYPRLESSARWSAFALSIPGTERAPRAPILLLVAEKSVLSLSCHASDLQEAPGFPELPWGARCALHVIRRVLAGNEALAARVEQELRELEELDADETPQTFFESTFRLKRQLGLAKGDLWRLRNLLAMLAERRRQLPGLGHERDFLRELSEQADYLHETVDKAQEQLLTLLDLHLNIASYDVNRFMRLLAVVSSLALIPTIVGGLLGMNLIGNPWPVTLGQVGFATFILMLGVLYTFLAKGWLR